MDFHPTSDLYLAYPLEKSVLVLNTTDWTEKFRLTADSVDANYSIVQYSPCGKFLAAASQDGCIVVWNTSTQTVVDVSEHPLCVAICAMAWNPTGKSISVFHICFL